MKQMYNWKLGMAITALVLSVVSAWAEINGSLMVDSIASIGYLIVLSVFIVLDILSLKKISSCTDDTIRLKKFKIRYDGILAFVLLMIAIIGLILHLNDADILIQNIFDVLFALCLVIKVIIETLELGNLKE